MTLPTLPDPSPPSARLDEPELRAVVDALCADGGRLSPRSMTNPCEMPLPSRDAIAEMVEALRAVLFPGYFGASDLRPESIRFHVGATLDRALRVMQDQVQRGLCFACESDRHDRATCRQRARAICRRFVAELPAMQSLLRADAEAAFVGDPAARSPDETVFCYPGVLAITSHRIAHALHTLGVPLLPRIINEQAHGATGIDIHPGASIGRSFFIDHGTGVVIGETCRIGDRVRIYQGVTLGAKSFPLDAEGRPVKGVPRHPIIEDDVTIYAGATILGRVTIGKGSTIGGNVWLLRNTAPGSRIIQTANQETQLDLADRS